MSADRPRVLSGIQPTSDSFHLGNYLGAVQHWVALQDTFDAFYFMADLHAITVQPHNPETLRQRTRVAAAQLLAAGLDPDRCTIFVQSHVPLHAELGWVLMCLTGFGEASRMTQFKDRTARYGSERIGVGMFAYPMLQAADILIYQADRVPVGEDQRQHLELSRDLAQRFNSHFGETFTVPEPHIIKGTAKIVDLQDPSSKMSKSSESQTGVIELLEDVASARKKIKRAVTDTGTEVRYDPEEKAGVSNLLTIYATLTGRAPAELEKAYAGKGYGALKTDLAEVVADFMVPFQERTRRWLDDPEALDAVLADGATRATAVANETMAAVRERVGFLPAKA